MILWPNEIAAAIVTAFEVTDPKIHATIVWFTLLAWFASWVAACAAVAGACYTAWMFVRWIARGVTEALADEGYDS